ncbi:hypothetical protein DDQ50_03695 [Amnibacterium flavum]|uniref:GAF domain-containing protein n=2 Tax=Amnibacterium flavum TaxID=2173173 RepID=A0A2V1HY09_9MICO|nr:hypothetical protein DDQ50_03695 [Amnibacterium flavum]
MKLFYAYQLSKGSDVPRPRTPPSVAIGDESAARVLLVGNGPCHGWGVASHTLALAGGLAGELARRNSRGARVDYVGDEIMNIAAAVPWLGATDLSTYDSVAVVVGMNDAVRLTRLPRWERDLLALVEHLRSGTRPGVRIALAGIQPVRSVPAYDSPLGSIAETHARRLSGSARAIAERFDDVDFFELGAPVIDAARRYGSPLMYRRWAGSVIAALEGGPVSRVLEGDPEIDPALHSVAIDVDPNGWRGLLRAAELEEARRLTEIERITAEARERFGVRIASVSLADGDRIRYVGHGGREMPLTVPLELTHCATVIDASEPLVVPKTSRDDRFNANPLIDLTHMEFYAGIPLLSSSGETIGSFCLMHPLSKNPSATDVADLRSFAARAQAELQRLETEVGGSDDAAEDGSGSVPQRAAGH